MKSSSPNTKQKIHENSLKFWIFCTKVTFDFLNESDKLTYVRFDPNLLIDIDIISYYKIRLSYLNSYYTNMGDYDT